MESVSRNEELRALMALRSSHGLAIMGCRFERGLIGGIAVLLPDATAGAWWHDGEAFCFGNRAYGAPVRTGVAASEVVSVMASLAASHASLEEVGGEVPIFR